MPCSPESFKLLSGAYDFDDDDDDDDGNRES